MTISAPPRPPQIAPRGEPPVEPSALQEEALIEEARQRAYRRRRRYGACLVLVAAVVALVSLTVGRDGEGNGSVAETLGSRGARSGLPRNGPLTIVYWDPTASSQGGSAPSPHGLYEVDGDGLGKKVFGCGGDTPCWELEGAAWAPDGKRLAYGAESIGGNPVINGLYVFDVTNGRSRQIRRWNSRSERGGWYEIAWSPDGDRIAYVTPTSDCCTDRSRIFLINPDGTHRTMLDTGTGSAEWPSWSPDGTRIAFATTRIGRGRDDEWPLNGSIYAMSIDGTHRTLIARHGTAPAWSPDGTRIAYLSGCGPPPFRITRPTGIRIVTPDGRNLTPRTESGCATAGIAGAPAWSPDGTKIAIANRTGVYLTDADGTNLTQVSTKAPASIASNHLSWARPAWQPLP